MYSVNQFSKHWLKAYYALEAAFGKDERKDDRFLRSSFPQELNSKLGLSCWLLQKIQSSKMIVQGGVATFLWAAS